MDYIYSGLYLGAEVLWFYLPVLVTNAAIHSVFMRFGLDIPADLYYCDTKGERFIGPSRSVGGAVFWLFVCSLVGALQGRIPEAVYLGAGGFVGTILNSLIKRRVGISQGKNFYPLDQTDFIIGASAFYASAFTLRLDILIGGLLLCGLIHLLVNVLVRGRWEKMLSKP